MDPNFMIKLMYNVHVSETMKNPPAFTYTIIVKNLNLKKNFPQNDDEKCELLDYFFAKFKQTNKMYGTIDVNPSLWFNIALSSILYYHSNNDVTFIFPNGCCNDCHCPINAFYKIIVEEFYELKN